MVNDNRTADGRLPVLECVDLAFSYPNSKTVFKDISLNVYKDELVAVVGPTGTGKSTLLRLIANLIPPVHGKVFLNGKEISWPTPDISLIHQSIATFPWMTAMENVELSLVNTKLSEEEIRRRAESALSLVGLEKEKDNYPKEMSGGMRQRIAIARALAARPEVMLLDEPFVHLDEFTAQGLRDEIHRLVFNPKTFLKSVILVSHNLNEVIQLADRVYIVKGSPAKIIKEVRIDMKRPRRMHDPEFFKYISMFMLELGLKEHRV